MGRVVEGELRQEVGGQFLDREARAAAQLLQFFVGFLGEVKVKAFGQPFGIQVPVVLIQSSAIAVLEP